MGENKQIEEIRKEIEVKQEKEAKAEPKTRKGGPREHITDIVRTYIQKNSKIKLTKEKVKQFLSLVNQYKMNQDHAVNTLINLMDYSQRTIIRDEELKFLSKIFINQSEELNRLGRLLDSQTDLFFQQEKTIKDRETQITTLKKELNKILDGVLAKKRKDDLAFGKEALESKIEEPKPNAFTKFLVCGHCNTRIDCTEEYYSSVQARLKENKGVWLCGKCTCLKLSEIYAKEIPKEEPKSSEEPKPSEAPKPKPLDECALIEQSMLKLAFDILFSTGLRKIEFDNLTWDAVNFDNHTLTIPTMSGNSPPLALPFNVMKQLKDLKAKLNPATNSKVITLTPNQIKSITETEQIKNYLPKVAEKTKAIEAEEKLGEEPSKTSKPETPTSEESKPTEELKPTENKEVIKEAILATPSEIVAGANLIVKQLGKELEKAIELTNKVIEKKEEKPIELPKSEESPKSNYELKSDYPVWSIAEEEGFPNFVVSKSNEEPSKQLTESEMKDALSFLPIIEEPEPKDSDVLINDEGTSGGYPKEPHIVSEAEKELIHQKLTKFAENHKDNLESIDSTQKPKRKRKRR